MAILTKAITKRKAHDRRFTQLREEQKTKLPSTTNLHSGQDNESAMFMFSSPRITKGVKRLCIIFTSGNLWFVTSRNLYLYLIVLVSQTLECVSLRLSNICL